MSLSFANAHDSDDDSDNDEKDAESDKRSVDRPHDIDRVVNGGWTRKVSGKDKKKKKRRRKRKKRKVAYSIHSDEVTHAARTWARRKRNKKLL